MDHKDCLAASSRPSGQTAKHQTPASWYEWLVAAGSPQMLLTDNDKALHHVLSSSSLMTLVNS